MFENRRRGWGGVSVATGSIGGVLEGVCVGRGRERVVYRKTPRHGAENDTRPSQYNAPPATDKSETERRVRDILAGFNSLVTINNYCRYNARRR